MDRLRESLEKLREKLKEDKALSSDKWNQYAQKYYYYSSVTIQTHMKVKDWEELKEEISVDDNERSITRRIERARKKLHKSIQETGLNSYKTIEMSRQINILINRYYKTNRNERRGRHYEEDSFMEAMYNRSYEHLKNIATIEDFPSIEKWNQYARKNKCLNSQSMQYIAGMNWHKIRDKIKNNMIFQKYEKYQKI